ncbi:MAG: 3-oxoacid CoA-transferase subunit B [Woeseia sp.]
MSSATEQEAGWSRDEIARNIALDIEDGAIVNLGIGMPELVASHIPPGIEVLFHTENGLLGMGLPPPKGQEDPELINAGKRPVTAIPGAAFFHHADSFAMIRGGHIDVCVLGAMEVSEAGDLANWSLGADDTAPAVGGAMDLVAGARRILIATRHCTRDGKPKLVKSCSYPVTGLKVVNRIYTDLAILEVCPEGLRVMRRAPGIGMSDLRRVTGATLVE